MEKRGAKSIRGEQRAWSERGRGRVWSPHLRLPLLLSRARALPSSLDFLPDSPSPFSLTSKNAWACRGSAKVTKANPLPSITARSESAPNLEAYSPSASTVVPSGMPPMKSLPA